MTYAKIITDSISQQGHRVTTMQVSFHRFVLAEMNTHRVFSRNSASSRAIPLAKQVYKVEHTPAIPVEWPAEQKGMQGGDAVEDVFEAEKAWRNAADDAVIGARRLGALGVHKSIANRLLEPFQMHTAVITATEWDGFWEQRCSPLAQPEIRVAAEAMKAAYDASTPEPLEVGDWHAPYITFEDEVVSVGDMVRISAARCARVSYLTQDGTRDQSADLALYERLVSSRPAHWSPLEHVATPWPENVMTPDLSFTALSGQDHHVKVTRPQVGNLTGWRQHRFEMENV